MKINKHRLEIIGYFYFKHVCILAFQARSDIGRTSNWAFATPSSKSWLFKHGKNVELHHLCRQLWGNHVYSNWTVTLLVLSWPNMGRELVCVGLVISGCTVASFRWVNRLSGEWLSLFLSVVRSGLRRFYWWPDLHQRLALGSSSARMFSSPNDYMPLLSHCRLDPVLCRWLGAVDGVLNLKLRLDVSSWCFVRFSCLIVRKRMFKQIWRWVVVGNDPFMFSWQGSYLMKSYGWVFLFGDVFV